jgi:hypothetical protein
MKLGFCYQNCSVSITILSSFITHRAVRCMLYVFYFCAVRRVMSSLIWSSWTDSIWSYLILLKTHENDELVYCVAKLPRFIIIQCTSGRLKIFWNLNCDNVANVKSHSLGRKCLQLHSFLFVPYGNILRRRMSCASIPPFFSWLALWCPPVMIS